MTANEIRQQFLDFFRSKQHEIVPSAPIVVKNDPTLMFTNAGMNQFKDAFLGNTQSKWSRVADTQKCLRVSGKHNDLEEVGVDTYHHTMFEMLGNWSFADYFKKEAIEWAWELLTEVYKIDKTRLYVTVFGGDEKDGLAPDTDAENIWKAIIAPSRILPCSKKDNFWEMGDTGPCGPCTEIHVDCRSDEERAKQSGNELVNKDHPQVIEIWNLVFIEFNRMADGSLHKLPAKHVDTGMGFERLTRVLQGKTSNYDTDIFQPYIQRLEQLSGKKYRPEIEEQDADALKINIAMRVIADHLRAISFTIADGQLPSNNGAGYVIRRILRRAVRYGYQSLNLKEPFLHILVEELVRQMGGQFPELAAQKDLVKKVIFEEEQTFGRTLETGLKKLYLYISLIEDKTRLQKLAGIAISDKQIKDKTLPGILVFELYDTFGFPYDLTKLIANENNLKVDEKEFDDEMQKQKNRSRQAAEVTQGDWVVLKEGEPEFVGYDQLDAETSILRYRKVSTKSGDVYHIVLEKTPFYAEGGGQVGDTGLLCSANEEIEIIDTKRENTLIIQYAKSLPENPLVAFTASVDVGKRRETQNNHSATHLMHEALREVLGTHVEQRGSLVNANYLRFDFSHFSKVTDEEIKQVEYLVNAKIRKNLSLEEYRTMPIEQAKAMGAMALFGEKYSDEVRVIKFGSSVELCGGTHVPSTAQIGKFKITTEGSVAAGIRRVEAITGAAADAFYTEQEELLNDLKTLLGNPKDLKKAVEDLLAANKAQQEQLDEARKKQATEVKNLLKQKFSSSNGVNTLCEQVDIDPVSLKDIVFQLRNEVENAAIVIGTIYNEKPLITVAFSDELTKIKNLNAPAIIKEIAAEINGGGGGQPFYASAGGKHPAGMDAAMKKAREVLISL
ncbi:MAG: alanine--tRNA ligase [Flavobacteriales bacterium]